MKTRFIFKKCRIGGYILAGVILTLCLLSSLTTDAHSLPEKQDDKVFFYLKNDLDRAILLKIDKSTVSIEVGATKKFNRPLNSIIYLANQPVLGLRPEKGKVVLKVKSKIKGKKIKLSSIIKE